MKDNLTEIVAILDRSGSMSSLVKDTIGGYNNFIAEQKNLPGEANITTVLFDDDYTLLHDRVDLKSVKPITDKEYFARGMTALLDAIGKTITDIGNKLNNIDEKDRPSKVIVLIITDGEENSSKEYSNEKIKEMIERQRKVYNWQFLFFGANIDSFSVAGSIGINLNHAVDFSATKKGVVSVYAAMTGATALYRQTGDIAEFFKEKVE
jgi:uncharacterized protein YegL